MIFLLLLLYDSLEIAIVQIIFVVNYLYWKKTFFDTLYLKSRGHFLSVAKIALLLTFRRMRKTLALGLQKNVYDSICHIDTLEFTIHIVFNVHIFVYLVTFYLCIPTYVCMYMSITKQITWEVTDRLV